VIRVDGAALFTTYVVIEDEEAVVTHRCVRCQQIVPSERLEKHAGAHAQLYKWARERRFMRPVGQRFLTVASPSCVTSLCLVCGGGLAEGNGEDELIEHTAAHLALGGTR